MFVIPFISTHGRDAIRTDEVFDEIILNIQAETMQVTQKVIQWTRKDEMLPFVRRRQTF